MNSAPPKFATTPTAATVARPAACSAPNGTGGSTDDARRTAGGAVPSTSARSRPARSTSSRRAATQARIRTNQPKYGTRNANRDDNVTIDWSPSART